MRMLLIRHGETVWNREGRYQGCCDPPLSAHGRRQVRLLAAELAACRACSVVSSPLRRAHETALGIGRRLGLDVGVEAGLCELSFGVWEGLTQAEVKARWPDALRRWKRQPDAAPPPGGEPLVQAAARVRRTLDGLADSLPGPTVAVTHAGVIRIARLLAVGAPLADFRSVPVANAEIVSLDWPPAGDLPPEG